MWREPGPWDIKADHHLGTAHPFPTNMQPILRTYHPALDIRLSFPREGCG